MRNQSPLTAAAAELYAALTDAMPEGVTVTTPGTWGYPHRNAPFAAIDPPKITRTEHGLATDSYELTADIVLAASSTANSPELLALADAAITAVRAAGLPISQVQPAALATAGGPQPAYVVTVSMTYTESRR